MVRVGRHGTQLVVLQLALLNKLLVADVFEVDADKLLGKLFRDSTSQVAFQSLVIEASAWSIMVEFHKELSKRMVGLVHGNKLLLSQELWIRVCKGVAEILDNVGLVNVLASCDLC